MLKAAVIGFGVMGKNHARIYNDLPHVKLVAICDIDLTKESSIPQIYKTKFYKNYLTMLKSEHPDLVSIATSTTDHYRIASKLIKNRINVLIEKPITSNSREAKKIIDLSVAFNTKMLVGHIENFNPAVIKLRTLIKNGEFGNILSIVTKRVGVFPPRIKDVNVVIDLAVHDLDIVRSLVGMPRKILAQGGSMYAHGKEDHVEIFLDYGKFGCFLQANWVTPVKIRTLSITGSRMYAELDYIKQTLDVYKTSIKSDYFENFSELVEKLSNAKIIHPKINFAEPLKNEISHFIDMVKNNEVPVTSGKDAAEALLLAELVNKSIKEKRVICL